MTVPWPEREAASHYLLSSTITIVSCSGSHSTMLAIHHGLLLLQRRWNMARIVSWNSHMGCSSHTFSFNNLLIKKYYNASMTLIVRLSMNRPEYNAKF